MEGSHWSSRVIFFFLLINLFTLCAELIHLEPFTWVTAAQWNLILTFALHCWSLRLLSLLTLHSTSSALYLHHRFETHALLRLRVHSSESYSRRKKSKSYLFFLSINSFWTTLWKQLCLLILNAILILATQLSYL